MRVDPVRIAQVVGDPMGIGDDGVRPPGAARLRPAVVARGPRPPLGALPLQPVDVHGHGDPGRTKRWEQRCVGRVEDERDVRVGPQDRVPDGQHRVAQRLSRALADCRQVDQAHAQVLGLGLARVAAVDDDVVATLHQASPDLLRGGLEAAVPRGHPPGPDQGDPHQPMLRCRGRSRAPDHWRPAPASVHPAVAGRVDPGAGTTVTVSSAGMDQGLGVGVDVVGPGREGAGRELVLHDHRGGVTGIGLVALPERPVRPGRPGTGPSAPWGPGRRSSRW